MAEEKKPDRLEELCNLKDCKMLIDELKERFVNVPLWSPGMGENPDIYFREGGRHLVMFLDKLAHKK